jgi:hypothetical protein
MASPADPGGGDVLPDRDANVDEGKQASLRLKASIIPKYDTTANIAEFEMAVLPSLVKLVGPQTLDGAQPTWEHASARIFGRVIVMDISIYSRKVVGSITAAAPDGQLPLSEGGTLFRSALLEWSGVERERSAFIYPIPRATQLAEVAEALRSGRDITIGVAKWAPYFTANGSEIPGVNAKHMAKIVAYAKRLPSSFVLPTGERLCVAEIAPATLGDTLSSAAAAGTPNPGGKEQPPQARRRTVQPHAASMEAQARVRGMYAAALRKKQQSQQSKKPPTQQATATGTTGDAARPSTDTAPGSSEEWQTAGKRKKRGRKTKTPAPKAAIVTANRFGALNTAGGNPDDTTNPPSADAAAKDAPSDPAAPSAEEAAATLVTKSGNVADSQTLPEGVAGPHSGSGAHEAALSPEGDTTMPEADTDLAMAAASELRSRKTGDADAPAVEPHGSKRAAVGQGAPARNEPQIAEGEGGGLVAAAPTLH